MSAATAIIIPARRGSTRMPEKMLRADTGRALVTYAVEAAERARAESAGAVREVIVATDDEAIVRIVNEYAASAGFRARAEMTGLHHQSGTDRIAEVVARLPADIGIIINIQGDEPDLPARDILRVGELLSEQPSAMMSTLVRPLVDEASFTNPNNVKAVRDRDGFCLYFSRAPIPFDRDHAKKADEPFGYLHLGIYGYRREALLNYSKLPASRLEQLEKLEQLRALSAGWKIVAAETAYAGKGIDTEADYQRFLSERSAQA
mgnify:CR=1 FL=1